MFRIEYAKSVGKGLKSIPKRVGEYRIVYSIEKQSLIVFVLRIRHRKDVYRGLV